MNNHGKWYFRFKALFIRLHKFLLLGFPFLDTKSSKINETKLFICDFQIMYRSIVLLCHYHWKKQMVKNIFGYKKSNICQFAKPKLYVIWFVSLHENHFIKSFLVQKAIENSIWLFFYSWLPNCGWFHLLFLTHDHFIEPKSEKVKYRFWLQKG